MYVGFALDTTRWWLLAIWFVLAGIGSDASRPPNTPPSPRMHRVQAFGKLAASGIAK